MSSTTVFCSTLPLSLDTALHRLAAQSQQYRELPIDFCERKNDSARLATYYAKSYMYIRGKIFMPLFSPRFSWNEKKIFIFFHFPAFLWISSTISYKYCLSQIPAEIKRTLCMKEEDHSFFSLRELCDSNYYWFWATRKNLMAIQAEKQYFQLLWCFPKEKKVARGGEIHFTFLGSFLLLFEIFF